MGWLDNEGLALLLVELVLQVVRVLGQNPGAGEEVEVLLEALLHAPQVLGQVVLAGEDPDVGRRVDALEGPQFRNAFGLHGHVAPEKVPVAILVVAEFEVHAAADALDDIVAAVGGAKDQLLGRPLFLLLDCLLLFGEQVALPLWLRRVSLVVVAEVLGELELLLGERLRVEVARGVHCAHGRIGVGAECVADAVDALLRGEVVCGSKRLGELLC